MLTLKDVEWTEIFSEIYEVNVIEWLNLEESDDLLEAL